MLKFLCHNTESNNRKTHKCNTNTQEASVEIVIAINKPKINKTLVVMFRKMNWFSHPYSAFPKRCPRGHLDKPDYHIQQLQQLLQAIINTHKNKMIMSQDFLMLATQKTPTHTPGVNCLLKKFIYKYSSQYSPNIWMTMRVRMQLLLFSFSFNKHICLCVSCRNLRPFSPSSLASLFELNEKIRAQSKNPTEQKNLQTEANVLRILNTCKTISKLIWLDKKKTFNSKKPYTRKIKKNLWRLHLTEFVFFFFNCNTCKLF